MRGGAVVAVITRQALFAEPVTLDLAIDRGFRALQHAGHLPNRDLCQLPAFDLDTFLDAQLRVNRSHGRLSPLDNHLFSNGSRT